MAVAAIDRYGGRDGEEVPSPSDLTLELVQKKVPGLTSEEAAVRAPVVRRAQVASQSWTGSRPGRIC